MYQIRSVSTVLPDSRSYRFSLMLKTRLKECTATLPNVYVVVDLERTCGRQ